ncbi:MAG TPA: CoA transferase [Stellaceae bacterium]|jgi:crotonobetainyl-CoA:carnitine CoA-transferase CaiB-like acyl-CoA transferase|nr:CoA transferase [Stellaceae bacterium]
MSDNTTEFNFLQGIKVVDFTQFEAGTTCTEVLAWFGAEVVKIENPGRGDPGRRLRPGKPDDDPWYFYQFNVNKKSIAINLKEPKGLQIVKDMIKQADIVAENMAPGTIERLGLSYEEVKAINPRIIYCQIKGFAAGSPHEKGLAFDMIAQAAGGPISVTGEPDRPPVKPGLSFGDTGTGMLMAATVLGALHERNRTGVGRRLEIAMQDAMIHYMRTCFATMARTGKAARRNGAKSGGGNNAPSGLYPAKGGGPNDYVYLTTSRANPEHWSRLCKLIGREDLVDDPRFATGNDRVAHQHELDAIIGEWTKQHDKRASMEKLIAVGVPSGAVFDTQELIDEPTFEQRGFMQNVKHHSGEYKMASWPVRVDGKSVRVKGSPALGGDTADVLHSWLGIDAGGVAALKSEGVL